jgi:hypothetical protein
MWKKDFAGLAKENRSTTTLFHRSWPIKARITSAIIKARITEREFIYTSRFESAPESDIPSTAARAPANRGDISI